MRWEQVMVQHDPIIRFYKLCELGKIMENPDSMEGGEAQVRAVPGNTPEGERVHGDDLLLSYLTIVLS